MYTSINSNLAAQNTARTLNGHYSRLSTSIQRLSTGLRVNSAADDAAGLAIRELQRADIAALQQGARNANDAISMIQVADGALSIIDEKLIRMKELAEQAATGTYDSTQRLMIASEFQAMASEIDRIANSTDFNGIKLLDGSLSGAHDGSGLVATGRMKIHFGTANDSAEDYYYVEIGACTTRGLGLRETRTEALPGTSQTPAPAKPSQNPDVTLNDCPGSPYGPDLVRQNGEPLNLDSIEQGKWQVTKVREPVAGASSQRTAIDENFKILIPAGSRNVTINIMGATRGSSGDNDIQLFTRTGVHLAGTALDDPVYGKSGCSLADNCAEMGFLESDYDGSALNTGYEGAGKAYDPDELHYTVYNNMKIGYTGDRCRTDSIPGNLGSEDGDDYETLTIDEATEDLIVWLPGDAAAVIKVYGSAIPAPHPPDPEVPGAAQTENIINIDTQDKAQKALVTLNSAILRKDEIRAHLGALQNRLENSVACLTIQAGNLQAAESRISDADVAVEMTEFVRNQILTQSAVAMLSQANSLPQMMATLLR